jgi:SAM-dependent MidA family methyltransferase
VGGGWLSVRDAWQRALYGPGGFYRREQPGDHYRTSAMVSAAFARGIAMLARQHALTRVVDWGAGSGELLTTLAGTSPNLELVGVDLRQPPPGAAGQVQWLPALPDRIDGLLVANELLDNIPCQVVELDSREVVRVVEVSIDTPGAERLGEPATPAETAWVEQWWPLATAGQRAEVGIDRELLWADACARLRGLAVAVDYGHLRPARPPTGTLTSYRSGRQTSVSFDGSHDITAHVAMDALQAAVGGRLDRQRAMLHELGVHGTRPALEVAATDPSRYVRELATASLAAELTAYGGLGDFFWLVTGRDGARPRRPGGTSTRL